MKFKDKNNSGFFVGRKNNFQFTISLSMDYNKFYVVASHLKKDIRLNTLWMYRNKVFKTFDDAVNFCEKFNHENFSKYTLGVDSNCA